MKSFHLEFHLKWFSSTAFQVLHWIIECIACHSSVFCFKEFHTWESKLFSNESGIHSFSSHESCGWGQREGEKHLVTLGEIASLIFSACLPNDMIKQSRMFFISLQTKSFFKECRALLFVDISRQHGYMRREANDKSFMVFRCTFIIGSYRSLFN